jgi:hypothetical protein
MKHDHILDDAFLMKPSIPPSHNLILLIFPLPNKVVHLVAFWHNPWITNELKPSIHENSYNLYCIMNFISKKKLGRPKRRKIEIIKTKCWFYVVQNISGKTANALAKEFSPEQFRVVNKERFKPTQWYKYKKGSVTPSQSLIDRVEDSYPGTKRVFDYILWVLLDLFNPDDELLKEGLGSANPRLVKYIGMIPQDSNTLNFPLTSERSLNALSSIYGKSLLLGNILPLYKFIGMISIALDGQKKNYNIQFRLAKDHIKKMLAYIIFAYFNSLEDDLINLIGERLYKEELVNFKLEINSDLNEIKSSKKPFRIRPEHQYTRL